MKQILVILVALSLAATAGAQSKVRGNYSPRARVIVAAPVYPAWGMGYGYYGRFSPFYDPFYSPFSPFNDPFYRNRVVRQEVTPSELQLELDKVDNDFTYKISSVRDDKSLSGKERRQKIRELRYQKEDALIRAKKNYVSRQQREQAGKSIE